MDDALVTGEDQLTHEAHQRVEPLHVDADASVGNRATFLLDLERQ